MKYSHIHLFVGALAGLIGGTYLIDDWRIAICMLFIGLNGAGLSILFRRQGK